MTVKPQARGEEVKRVDDGEYSASVRATAQEGKANKALTVPLTNHFSVTNSNRVGLCLTFDDIFLDFLKPSTIVPTLFHQVPHRIDDTTYGTLLQFSPSGSKFAQIISHRISG